MRKYGKFILGALSLAAVAGGAFYFLKNVMEKESPDEFEDFEDDFEDFDAEDEEQSTEDNTDTREYVTIPITDEDKNEEPSLDSEEAPVASPEEETAPDLEEETAPDLEEETLNLENEVHFDQEQPFDESTIDSDIQASEKASQKKSKRNHR